MRSLKKFSAIFILLMVFCSLNFCEAAKKRVAVMPLENVSGYTEQKVAEIMTQQLITAIHGSGNYTVVERFQMDAVLKEQGFQNITADPAKAVETGKLSGADYMLMGKVTMAEFVSNPVGDFISKFVRVADKFAHNVKCKIKFEFRMVDSATGEVVVASTVEGSQSGKSRPEALDDACKEAAENFLHELQKVNPLVARIIDISGSDIYLDKGSNDGLREGETLSIFRESDAIIVNGKIVGMKRNELGKAKVVEVNAEYSVCKVVGSVNVQKGDVVKRG